MLIYEKDIDGNVKLFGSVTNIPTPEDKEIVLRDADGDQLEIIPGDEYFDDGHGGMTRKSDGKFVAVNIITPELTEINVIPGDCIFLGAIAITTPPTKVEYIEGQEFDPTGMVVTATYLDGHTEDISDYTYTPTVLDIATTEVIITFGGKTASVEVTVSEKVLTEITATRPTKTEYTAGETFDPTGMVVTAHYNDGTSVAIPDTDYTYSPTEALTTADTEITITYLTETCIVTITVNE